MRACWSSARRDGRAARSGRPSPGVFSLHVVQAGSACPHDAGRPAPTAFNRAGEKLRAAGGELPRVSSGVVPDGHAGSLSPLIGGGRSRAPVQGGGKKRWSGSLRLVLPGVVAAGGTGGDGGIPAGAVDDHAVDPAQQGGGARNAGLGAPGAGRGLCRCALLRSGVCCRGVCGAGHRLVLGVTRHAEWARMGRETSGSAGMTGGACGAGVPGVRVGTTEWERPARLKFAA